MEIPFGLQAVKILSLFEFIVTEGRSNFRDTVSSRPETSSLTFSSFVAHLLSGSICMQHLARLPIYFHNNNNTLHFHPQSPEHFANVN